jgi:hypothetical protein
LPPRHALVLLLLALLLAGCAPGPTPATTPTWIPPSPTEALPVASPVAATESAPTSIPSGLWTGAPTYALDTPQRYQLIFDPALWTLNPTGSPTPADRMLQHQTLPDCTITPAAGHGLGPGWTTEHGSRQLAGVTFETVAVSENGVLRFVNYFTGRGEFYTGFGVAFEGQPTQCLEQAEAVLATFRIVELP